MEAKTWRLRNLGTLTLLLLSKQLLGTDVLQLWVDVPNEQPNFFFPTDVLATPDESLTAKTCAPGDVSKGYFNVTVPEIHAFILPRSSKPSPVVLVVPGGGGDYLAWEKEGVDVAQWLNSIGMSAYVLKYRVPKRPWLPVGLHDPSDFEAVQDNFAAVLDTQRAIKFVRRYSQNNPQYGLDPSRMVAIGFGYGASLIKTVVAQGHGPKMQLYDWVCPVEEESSIPNSQLLLYPEAWGGVVHSHRLGEAGFAFPATLTIGAWDDQCSPVPDTIDYYDRTLSFSGEKTSELHIFADGGSSCGTCSNYEAEPGGYNTLCQWTTTAKLFLRLHLLKDIPQQMDFLLRSPEADLPFQPMPSPFVLVAFAVIGMTLGIAFAFAALRLAARKRGHSARSSAGPSPGT